MSRNIKEIGKELMGRSLNSFHRKTGLTQLEENNKMQDGILDGILSQVDNAYIEKTEQSNVIHLDGSGDGVVVVNSIEGNTMVNLLKDPTVKETGTWTLYGEPTISNGIVKYTSDLSLVRYIRQVVPVKHNTTYTAYLKIKCTHNFVDYPSANLGIDLESNDGSGRIYASDFVKESINNYKVVKCKITTLDHNTINYRVYSRGLVGESYFKDFLLLEGDWIDKEIPPYFEGLQSSFKEKVNNEGKYEIEILIKNKNLLDLKNPVNVGYTPAKMEGDKIVLNSSGVEGERISMAFPVYMKKGSTYRFSYSNIEGKSEVLGSTVQIHSNLHPNGQFSVSTKMPFTWDNESGIYYARIYNMYVAGTVKANVQLEENNIATTYIEPKQNKIKLLLDEPLRKVNNNYKDRLCIKDGRLVVERKCGIDKNLHLRNWTMYTLKDEYPDVAGFYANVLDMEVHGGALVCDKFKCMERDMHPGNVTSNEEFLSGTGGMTPFFKFNIKRDKLSTLSADGFKTYLQQNPVTVVYPLLTPIYEEVLNECGDPILLEGYENGTVYIDSTIVPTTTVRYTPKMESLKTLKAVNDNNIMLTDDINNNIIDYMMNIDMMIMEKEMQNTKTRRIGEKDMTNMQKRTFEMLKRLIKGKTLTEQECKDRVVLYLSADKITSEQAEELMVYISEIYN